MNGFLYILWYVHVLLWGYLIFSPFFMSKKACKLNLFIFIPLVYIIHILPFHILTEIKKGVTDSQGKKISIENQREIINKHNPVIGFISNCQETLENYCTYNPIGGQGMLILAYIINLYAVYYPDYPFKTHNII